VDLLAAQLHRDIHLPHHSNKNYLKRIQKIQYLNDITDSRILDDLCFMPVGVCLLAFGVSFVEHKHKLMT
jgi:hypothetical protein